MTRKKVNLAYITNDSERKASFKKRKKGLVKKASELKTLCDVPVCVIIYSPYDRQPEVWPNHERAMAIIQRFRSLSEMDQTRKMFNQDSFNRERIRKTEETARKWRKENRRKELQLMMAKGMYGELDVSQLDPTTIQELKQTIHNYLRDLKARYEKNLKGKGKQVVGHNSMTLPPLPALPAPSDYTPHLPPLDQFHNQFVPSGSELMPLTQNAGNQNYPFTGAFDSGSAVNALLPPVNLGYKFPRAFVSSIAGNALPPPVNQEYEQFTDAFDPKSALVPIGSPYAPISHPQLPNVVEPSQPAPTNVVEPLQPQAPYVMEPPPSQPAPGYMVEPTGGGEENFEALPWDIVKSPKGGNNVVGGLRWDDVIDVPPNLMFNKNLYNPSSSVATYNHNVESSQFEFGSGSFVNSTYQVAPGLNQNSTFDYPSNFNTFGSSDVAPGSGSLWNQDSNSFNPSGSEVARGSVVNKSSTFNYPGTFNSSTDVASEYNLNPDHTSVHPSKFNPGTFDPSSSNVAPGSVVNPDSTFSPLAFDATLGSVVYPNSALNPWIFDVAPGSAYDLNQNLFNPSTHFPATFNPSNSSLASDGAPGSGFNPSTFEPSNSTADAAPGSSNNGLGY